MPRQIISNHRSADHIPRSADHIPRSADHIPRPPNAWMIFRSEKSKSLRAENMTSGGPTKRQGDFSVEISAMWRSLDPEEKKKYQIRAEEADRAHKKAHPGYRYRPGPKKQKRSKKVVEMAVIERDEGSTSSSSSIGSEMEGCFSYPTSPAVSLSPLLSSSSMCSTDGTGISLSPPPQVEISSSNWRYYQPEMAATVESPWGSQPPSPSGEQDEHGVILSQVEFCLENPIFATTPSPAREEPRCVITEVQRVEVEVPCPVIVSPQISPEIVAFNPALEWLNFLDRELWSDDQVALVEETVHSFQFHSFGF